MRSCGKTRARSSGATERGAAPDAIGAGGNLVVAVLALGHARTTLSPRLEGTQPPGFPPSSRRGGTRLLPVPKSAYIAAYPRASSRVNLRPRRLNAHRFTPERSLRHKDRRGATTGPGSLDNVLGPVNIQGDDEVIVIDAQDSSGNQYSFSADSIERRDAATITMIDDGGGPPREGAQSRAGRGLAERRRPGG